MHTHGVLSPDSEQGNIVKFCKEFLLAGAALCCFFGQTVG